jgi:hypothetical protein
VRLALVTLLFAGFSPTPAAQSGAEMNGYPVGTPVTAIIEFGDQYLGSELYNARITVLVRGEKAWDIVKQASTGNLALNSPPAPRRRTTATTLTQSGSQ